VPKQKYRLQPVLTVREKAKQTAAKMLANRRAQLAAAEAELALRKAAVDDCRARQLSVQDKMMAETQKGVVAHGLVLYRTHLADLRRIEQELIVAVEAQQRIVSLAENEVEKALSVMIEASKDVQVIEKHHEAWQQKTRREEDRNQQKLGDEIGTITHRRHERP
jgi:flagellar export protein FliJ